jgi:hypothetical protein
MERNQEKLARDALTIFIRIPSTIYRSERKWEAMMKKKTAILVLAVTESLPFVLATPHVFAAQQETAKQQASASRCATKQVNELTITCAYTAESPASTGRRSAPRIILDRATISFVPSNESQMSIELTFTNDSESKIVDQRTVYLAIDDERGDNHMRRPLPRVDFTKLEPHHPMKFQETLLAPAFSPGPYILSIWIPSALPSWKFDPAHNFLLSSNGVPDRATGLNRIAKFTVSASVGRKSTTTPN